MEETDLLKADLIALMPCRITRAKNIEYALRVIAALKASGLRPKLVVTGPPDPHSSNSEAYWSELLALRGELELEQDVVFIYEGTSLLPGPLTIDAPTVAELFRACDLVLMPSHREGFGMPILEGGLVGKPVFCTAVPVLEQVGAELVYQIEQMSRPIIWRREYSLDTTGCALSPALARSKRLHMVCRFSTGNSAARRPYRPGIGAQTMKPQDQTPFRLIVVSNRGPYHLRVTPSGLKREKTVGGLVSSMLPVLKKLGGVWVAWGDPVGCYPGSSRRSSFDLRYISLTPDQIAGYYNGLANNALWPLCHYFLDRVHYDDAQWQTYEEVNQQFARAALDEAQSDDVIWVHDYHLARVPYYVRREQPSMRIAFFWHIPFPSVEVFRTLPWRRPFLESLLTCDWVGFHIPEYSKNFMAVVHDVLGGYRGWVRLLCGTDDTRVVTPDRD
jgi:hypothetical protein